MDDKLKIMLEMQKELQQRINKEKFGEIVGNQEYISQMTLAITDEIYEALRETKWKYWSKTQTYNKENFQKELIDSWHFFMNLLIAADIDADKLFDMYCEKNKINHERQKNNY